MQMSADAIRAALKAVDTEGWDGPAATQLLMEVRRHVVHPLVAACPLRGPAARQAEATAWAVCWEVLRRRSTADAQNPAGVLWVAARRAIAREVAAGRSAPPVDHPGRAPILSTDPRWPEGPPGESWLTTDSGCEADRHHQSILSVVIGALVDAGWQRDRAVELVLGLIEEASLESGTTRWRCVAVRLGVPQWQVRRLGELLLGGPGYPGLAALVAHEGAHIVAEPRVRAAISSTVSRGVDGPRHQLPGVRAPMSRQRSAAS